MSHRLAEVLWRWRRVLCTIIALGAVAFAPSANITKIDNDLTAWFSVDDPIYKDYARFRDEFGGTRTLIIAIEAKTREQLLSAEGLGLIDDLSSQIEKVQAVQRVSSLATATVIDALPATASDDDVTTYVTPLVRRLAQQQGVDLASIAGTGVGGRIRKEDVLQAAARDAGVTLPVPEREG